MFGVCILNRQYVWMFTTLCACNTGKVTLEKVNEDFDGRFLSQVFVWECQEGLAEDTGQNTVFNGTYGHQVALYYAPGNLDDLLLNEGCFYGLDMFPTSGGSGGSSLEELVGYPTWSNSVSNGLLEGAFGYWFQDVLTDEHTCLNPEAILSDPMTLDNALGLSSVSISESYTVPLVQFSDGISQLSFGETQTIRWNVHDWPRSWVHIRRTKANQPVEVLTCTTFADTQFTIDDQIWEYFDQNLSADSIDVFVGFESRDVQRSADGSLVEALNRAVAVPVEN